jgi:Cytochrome c3
MTFIVRQISRTVDGREIVRPQTFQGQRIVIGRDAGSEVHLADLAVELNQAEILQLESGRIEIQSVCGLDFELDGRRTRRAEIDPAKGGELRVGSHLLRIASDGSAVIVSVERVEALSDASEEKEETGLFTLKGLLPGRRPMAWGLIATVMLLFLAWPIYTYATSHGVKDRGAGFHADKMWSTGSLSLAHKSLENNCQACHTEKFVSVTDKTCLTCHKDDAHDHAKADRIALAKAPPGWGGKVKGFFKTSFNHPDGRCVDCHTEHEGAGKMPPTAQAFCSDCHSSLNTRLTDTKLGNAGDFGLEHPQFKPAVSTGIDASNRRLFRRVSFDAKPVDDNGLKFPHGIHLSKTNGIARMTQTMKAEQGWGDSLVCKDCHTPSADGTRFKPVDMEADCQMCHSLAFDKIDGTFRTLRHGQPAQVAADLRAFYRSTTPDRPIGLGGLARRRPGDYAATAVAQDYALGARLYASSGESAIRAVFSRGGACYDCHIVTPGSSAAVPFNIRKVFQPTRYLQKGWFDHDAHKSETCVSCHNANTSKSATDLLLPDLASCRTCHVGESGAKLKPVSKPVESGCAMCHDYHMDGGAPWVTRDKANRAKGTPRFSGTIASAR